MRVCGVTGERRELIAQTWGKIMSKLVENLMAIAAKANKSDALVIEAAIDRIMELEAKMSSYEEDVTDWQGSVEMQMRRRKDDR